MYPRTIYARCQIFYQPCVQLWLTIGILNSLSKLATWIDVTLDAAPTTPDMTLFWTSGDDPSLHLYSATSSMFVIEPTRKKYNYTGCPKNMSHTTVSLRTWVPKWIDSSLMMMNIDGQNLQKYIPFIAQKVANKIAQSCKIKLQINKPCSLNSEILFNQNFVWLKNLHVAKMVFWV